MLPTFLVVGAARSGTTSLYHYLKAHPDIYMSPVKEPHFFPFINSTPDFRGPYDARINEEIVTDFEKYRALFSGVGHEKAIGECSNSYLYFHRTASVIKKHIPHCKIIMVLRNPVTRAYSHYLQTYMIGHEDRSFEEAIRREAEREKLNWRWHYQYVKQGLYYRQVKSYLDVFGRESVRIYLFDDLAANTARVVGEIYAFLGVDASFVPHVEQAYNRTGMPRSLFLHRLFRHANPVKRIARSLLPQKARAAIHGVLSKVNYDPSRKPGMSEDVRRRLNEFFREDIGKLESLTGRDLSHWLESGGPIRVGDGDRRAM